MPCAWRRPWRVLRSDRLDETKGSDCSKRRGVSDPAHFHLFLPARLSFRPSRFLLCVQWARARIERGGERRGTPTELPGGRERTCKITRGSLGARELARIPRENGPDTHHHPLSLAVRDAPSLLAVFPSQERKRERETQVYRRLGTSLCDPLSRETR